MHIVGLRLTNWMRFRGDHELDLRPTVYAIVAAAAEDPQRSNWLCKSGLLSALRWALDGRRPERFKSIDQAISRGESEMAVDVEFSDGSFLSRSKQRGKSEQLVAEFPGADPGARLVFAQVEAEAELWRRLALTPDDALTTCFAEQGRIDSLATMRSSELTDVIGGWLELDRLVQAHELVGERFRRLSNERDDLVKRAQALREKLAEQSLADLKVSLDEAERRFAQAKVNAERFEIENQAYVNHRLAVERVNAARTAAAEADRLEREAARIKAPDVEELRAAEEKLARARSRKDEEQKRYQRLKVLSRGEFDGQCPVSSGFDCPVREQINRRNVANKTAVEEQMEKLAGLEDACVEALRELEAGRELARRKSDLVVQAAAMKRAAKVSEGDVQLARRPVSQPAPVASPDDREVRIAHEALEAYKLNAAALEEVERELAAKELELSAVRLAYAALGPEGVQRRVSERSVRVIQSRANDELSRIADLTVLARWGRETQELSTQCPECGRAFPASRKVRACEGCGAPRGPKVKPELKFELSDVSGAALVLAGLALRTGAFRWLKERRSSPWAVAVLDEPFGALDRAHAKALSAHVQRLLEGTYEQAFVVAHDAGVLDSLPSRILITGRGEWSEAKVVG